MGATRKHSGLGPVLRVSSAKYCGSEMLLLRTVILSEYHVPISEPRCPSGALDSHSDFYWELLFIMGEAHMKPILPVPSFTFTAVSDSGEESEGQRRKGICLRSHSYRIPVQFSLIVQSLSSLCDPMDCSTSSFLVRHQLPELIQTHVH